MEINGIKIILFSCFCVLHLFACSQEKQKKSNTDEITPKIDQQDVDTNAVFDSEIWKKSNFKERAKYTDDIQKNERVLHLSRNEVVKLLGKPDVVSMKENAIKYKVDLGGRLNDGTPILHVLYIKFNDNDICISVRIFDYEINTNPAMPGADV